MIKDLWYKNAVIYCLHVGTFMDGNGDGIGDFEGLIRRLDYLAGLGITCVWLMPFQKSPRRDDGYDISDYYAVDDRYGTLGDFVDFTHEISVIVARGPDGSTAIYQPVENQHKNHILDVTLVPARISQAVAGRAEAIARHIANEIGLVGLLAVEMFVTHNDEVLVNELAPRPHNSGHWTIDACYTSQFEQLVRAICGLPLGSPERHADAVMKNLIGADIAKWREAINDPLQKIHLYGKSEVEPGRKMGHVTKLVPRR